MLHAVVVGIDNYRDSRISPLSFARADAEAMAKLLEDGIHPADRSIRRFMDGNATKRALQVAIGEELPRLVEMGDLVLIYIACHGTPESLDSCVQASRYLIAHDTSYENLYADGIDMEIDLQRWFERISNAALIVLMLDACFSGQAGGRTFEGPQLRRRRAKYRTREPISLKNLDLGEGRVMLAACQDDQVASEQRTLGHGVFTHFLLQALGRSSTEEDRTVGLGTLYEEVAAAVKRHTQGRQIPTLNGRQVLAHLPRLG